MSRQERTERMDINRSNASDTRTITRMYRGPRDNESKCVPATVRSYVLLLIKRNTAVSTNATSDRCDLPEETIQNLI